MFTSESKMSMLQKAYREFFKKKLEDYGVASPAKLNKEDKSKFFSEVKSDWKTIKKSVRGPGKSHSSDDENYGLDSDFESESKQRGTQKTNKKKAAKGKKVSTGPRKTSPGQEAYRKFFKAKLEKAGVKSPFALKGEERSKFFAEVKSEWASQKGKSTSSEYGYMATAEDYREYFRGKMEEAGVKSPKEIPEEDRAEFWSDVKSGWKKAKKA